MKRFSTFISLHEEHYLSEAITTLGNTERHLKYIKPPLNIVTNTRSLSGEKIPAGTKAMPVLDKNGKPQTKVNERGSIHVHVKTSTGEEHHVPMSSIQKISPKSGKHSDEAGVIAVWNHFSGKKTTLPKMHSEISKAESDESHPLHISNADPKEFANEMKDSELAHKSYYHNLRSGAYLVDKLQNHPDFKPLWQKRYKAYVEGATTKKLSKKFIKEGVKGMGATSKGDVIMFKGKKEHENYDYPGKTMAFRDRTVKVKQRRGMPVAGPSISLKQAGGSQIISSYPDEAVAIIKHAHDEMLRTGHTDEGHHQYAHKMADRLRKHMRSADMDKAKATWSRIYNHKKVQKDGNNLLFAHILHEGLSGKGKFSRSHRYPTMGSGAPFNPLRQPGVATHFATIPDDSLKIPTEEKQKRAKVGRISLDKAKKMVATGEVKMQGISTSKTPGGPLTLRIQHAPRKEHWED